ncbi:MATE family efflux transporter [Sphingobacterium alkalisoli]|uniref:Multidrug-efflux transporter n=1 Tax=Sphingobacterium alkalisoli TaxID=1874115 RepID=A0A4U0GPF1_9SPHI|nr:MATE family efflux transporter [Sphingobacterium alkalisoli]TJY60780.1 MATE family efflux transporter [Sphingobacterium alkalisoli]GGH31884.1 MATE family efflux transporter [Sphingobacterium alkalisoli]
MLSSLKVNKNYYLSTIALAGPVVISQLGHTLVQTADTMIVGHFAGRIPLAAVSLSHSFFMVVLVIGIGIAYGLTPLIAQENGKTNKEECAKLLSNSFWINFFTGIILFCCVYFGSMVAMDYAEQDPRVVKEAKPYLFLLSLSIWPLMVFNTFKQFAEGLGFTKQAMNITIWGNVLNVLVAIILVKGMFGFDPMGIRGVGLATLIDRVLMMIVMMTYVLRAKSFKSYLIKFDLFFVQWQRIKNILRIGAPVAMQYVFEIGAFAGASVIAGQIGALEQASHQVAITLAAMTYMMASGIAAAATIKTGNSFGNNKYDRLQKFARVSYHLVLIFMVVTAIIFAVFNQYLPRLITTDTAVIQLSAQLLIIAGLFQLFDGTQVVGLGVLRGMGDVNIPTLFTFIAYWIIGLPIGYFMGVNLRWGVQGVWYGLTLGLLTSSLLLYLRYRYIIKRHLVF